MCVRVCVCIECKYREIAINYKRLKRVIQSDWIEEVWFEFKIVPKKLFVF